MKKHIKSLKKKLKIFDPKLKEECGVFGISNAKDASALTALGLHALQHRGCLLYTSPSPRDISGSRMPSSA